MFLHEAHIRTPKRQGSRRCRLRGSLRQLRSRRRPLNRAALPVSLLECRSELRHFVQTACRRDRPGEARSPDQPSFNIGKSADPCLQYSKVEVTLAIRTLRHARIGHDVRDRLEMFVVFGIEDSQGKVCPIYLDREVVPCVRSERCGEQHVQRMIAYFERVCVWSRQWPCGICER